MDGAGMQTAKNVDSMQLFISSLYDKIVRIERKHLSSILYSSLPFSFLYSASFLCSTRLFKAI